VSIRTLLGSLFAFGALNAFAGGYYGLSGADGVPREWLAGSPFSDYVVPSLALFVVVGGALALAAIMVFRGHPLARAIACAASAVLLAWIVVQVAIIGYVSWMQPATFAAGLLMLLLISLLPSTASTGRKVQ
jgi:peptidoglycan/LPS O-acetylase OafA/YrhL